MPRLTPDKRKQIHRIKSAYRRTIDVGIVLSLTLVILIFYSFQRGDNISGIPEVVPVNEPEFIAPPRIDPPKKTSPLQPGIPVEAPEDTEEELIDETWEEPKFTEKWEIEPFNGTDKSEPPIVPWPLIEIKPKLIKTVPTVYPELAVMSRLEGQVVLRVLIGTDGRVEKVQVLKSIKGLNQAAIDAAKQYVFSPAIQVDKKVKVWMAIPVQFKLQ